MLSLSGSDIDTGLLQTFFETSEEKQLGFSREQIERRLAIVTGAGISDPEDLRRHVLSKEAA